MLKNVEFFARRRARARVSAEDAEIYHALEASRGNKVHHCTT